MSRRLRLAAHGFELELAPGVGGAITAFRLHGQDLMRPAPADLSDVLQAACFPLVPYVNRVRDGRFLFRGREVRLTPNLPGDPSPLHGQGWRHPWSVVESAEDQAELAYDHAPGEWPWAYAARQRFRLTPLGLDAEIEVTNRSTEPMPAGLGFHPYYPCTPDTVLSAKVDCVWTVDDKVLPVAREPATGRYDLSNRHIDGAGLDNGFGGWSGRAELTWRDRGLRLALVSDEPFLQVYAPPEGGVVVVEPVSQANDALAHPEGEWPSLGLRVLAPGETATLEARFEASAL
jgi:aldose 1-epimerase